MRTEKSGPLKGVTVLEIAGIGPGPFACMMLADLGARVIRVDRIPGKPSGSAVEALMRNDGVIDRGRESIAIDMKRPEGIEAILTLIERADILIEGFRPGVTERLGFGPEACFRRNPRLIYGRMSGWGQDGPLSQAAGHDLNYIALSGALYAMGSADSPPTPPLNLVGDYGGGGMMLALGVVAALVEARNSGQGQVVDAAMSDGAAVLMAAQYGMLAKGLWHDKRGKNFLDGAAHFYGTYACADGHFVAIAAIEPQFYRQLLTLCEISESDFERQWNADEWSLLKSRLAALFLTRTRDQWCTLLEGSDACFAPVLSMQEAPLHPHNQARATFVESNGTVQPAPAPRFSRTQGALPPPAPRVGRDSLALLREAGYSEADLSACVEGGAIYQGIP